MAINEKYLQEKCKAVMTITCRHIVVTLAILYFVMAAITYGSTMARWDRERIAACKPEEKQYSWCRPGDPVNVVPAFIGGLLWPITLPFYLSYSFFK